MPRGTPGLFHPQILRRSLFFYHAARPIEFDAINWQLRLIDHPERHQDLE